MRKPAPGNIPPSRPPPIGTAPQARKVDPGSIPRKKCWRFSFQYWKQREYFGLNKSDPAWFVSFLERLQELSEIEIDALERDPKLRDWWRYHIIDWNAKNIPIQRHELDWLPRDIRDNEEEFPLFQLQVSKARGRIIGFRGEDDVFYIVLLDPLHNLQPSRDFSYRIDPCYKLSCKHTELLLAVDRAREDLACTQDECSIHRALANLAADTSSAAFFPCAVVIGLDDQDLGDVRLLLEEQHVASMNQLLKRGIKSVIDGLDEEKDARVVPPGERPETSK